MRQLLACLLFAVWAFWPGNASADGTIDTVMLTNGGRLRGVVMIDDRTAGITIKLIDGTTRQVKRSDVASVDYGAPSSATPSTPPPPQPPAPQQPQTSTAPAPAAAPVASAVGAPAPVTPPGVLPALNDERAGATTQVHRSRGLNGGMVAGIVLISTGAVAGGVGGALLAVDGDSIVPGASLAVGGGVALLAGIISLSVGAATRSSDPPPSVSLAPIVSPGFTGVLGRF